MRLMLVVEAAFPFKEFHLLCCFLVEAD